MTDRTHARLLVLAVLVMSLVVTLAARAFSLQVGGSEQALAAAADNRQRELVLPATRGLILDQAGRPLATNRIALDVSVARRELRRLDDDGAAVLERLAALVGVDAATLAARLQNCGTPGARRQPDCWNGAPGADPVVARDIGAARAGAILAAPAAYPALAVVETPVRQYPAGTGAAHAVGHVGRVSAEDLAADPSLEGIATLGRAGLEQQYDEALRGRPGLERVEVDSAGHRESGGVVEPAEPGQTLVTTLDLPLQAVVEEQLAAAIERARGRVDPITKRRYAADGGAAVVLDVRTGAVLALASAPTFDANVWTPAITADDYAALTDEAAGQPLLHRPLQAALPPASTFKLVSTAAALEAGWSREAAYDCPARYRAGGRWFRNYESRAYGPVSLARAMEVSCDTVFYRLADELWRADGGSDGVEAPREVLASTAVDFGFGTPTGIDLPGEVAGRVPSRAAKQALWEQRRDDWCRRAETGYPEVADRERAAYLQALAKENCVDGMRWRVGDALNAAIGQGDTAATVLQVAVAYAAVANGGTRWRPHVGRALLAGDGSVVRTIEPEALGTLDVPADDLAFLRRSLRGVIEDGTARGAFAGFPVDQVPIAGKTGTAEVFGKQSTSWFASFAPADEPRYAVVMMVEQGGTGAYTSGRSVRQVYEAIFGVRDGEADPTRSVLVGGDVAPALPVIGPDGVPVVPAVPDAAAEAAPEDAATGAGP
jgi:penicillin-binding protein 2